MRKNNQSKIRMNVFLSAEVANTYDDYYLTDLGKEVDRIEKEIISSLLKNIPKETMLELGCGTGHWTNYFLKQEFKVLGIDISEAMLKVAKSKNSEAEFLLADSENLPFGDESYHLIVSITMLEFVENQEKAICEMHRVLKPGGWLILGCLNSRSVIGRNKEKDEVFKNARFCKIEEIQSGFGKFDLLQTMPGVYLNSDYTLLDGTENIHPVEPVFIAAKFKKRKS